MLYDPLLIISPLKSISKVEKGSNNLSIMTENSPLLITLFKSFLSTPKLSRKISEFYFNFCFGLI